MSVLAADPVIQYLELGLQLGRHLDGLVDAYYGPAELTRRVSSGPLRPSAALADDARRLLGDLDVGEGDLEARRRRWLSAQVRGLYVTARKLAGESFSYVDEVEACYGVRPQRVSEDELAEAHRLLDEVVPGSGPLLDRFIAWREAQAVPVDRLEEAVRSLADDLQERTRRSFGLPDGERVEFQLVTDKPWAGFNYYLGDLHSRVAINIDLPVLSLGLGHLVAHEAYPGHHTEHCRKDVGLVRQRQHLEETIFLVGTPQCLLAEGLADLGIEVVVGPRPEPMVAEHLRPLAIPYDPDVAAVVADAAESLGRLKGNVALLLHEDGKGPDEAVAYVERWGLVPRARAAKLVEFLTDPLWRAYISCYVEGLPLCRRFVNGDQARFEQLISEQLVPADLEAA